MNERIKVGFDSVDLDGSQRTRVEAVREAYKNLVDTITHNSSSCREQSLALTNLEQSCMWAVKAIAHEGA